MAIENRKEEEESRKKTKVTQEVHLHMLYSYPGKLTKSPQANEL